MFQEKLISADSHVDEPLDLWQERLPAHLRHKAPHVEVRDGKKLMIQDGMRPKKMAMGSPTKRPKRTSSGSRDASRAGTSTTG